MKTKEEEDRRERFMYEERSNHRSKYRSTKQNKKGKNKV